MRSISFPGRFIFAFCATFVVVNIAIHLVSTPNYGTWTGHRTIEEKLRLLRDSAERAPIDALILSNSIGDYGFSAESFSRKVSALTGTNFNTFNFSIGGTTSSSLRMLYNLARLEAKPRHVILIMPPISRKLESGNDDPFTPNYLLSRAPVFRHLESPFLLKLSQILWAFPILHKASAFGDHIVSGKFLVKGDGSDLYRVNPYGDRVNFAFDKDFSEMLRLKAFFEAQLTPYRFQEQVTCRAREIEHFLHTETIEEYQKFSNLLKKDGIPVSVLSAPYAATALDGEPRSKTYDLAVRQFFICFASILGARLMFVLDTLRVPPFATADTTHLNVYGAKMLAEVAAHAWLNLPTPQPLVWQVADAKKISSANPSFSLLSPAIIRLSAERGTRLTIEFMPTGLAVPPLGDHELQIVLRRPDNVELFAPARRLSSTRIAADFPETRSEGGVAYLARIIAVEGKGRFALNQPIASYSWSE